jgi:hypothetical protein
MKALRHRTRASPVRPDCALSCEMLGSMASPRHPAQSVALKGALVVSSATRQPIDRPSSAEQ